MLIKKISWVPMYSDVTSFASTRIRLFYPNNSINTYHSDKYESDIGFDINSNILIIQKRIDNQTLTFEVMTRLKDRLLQGRYLYVKI